MRRITHNTHKRLLDDLTEMRENGITTQRYIYFCSSELVHDFLSSTTFENSLATMLEDENACLYRLPGGDAVLLCHALPRKTSDKIADKFSFIHQQGFMALHDLNVDIHLLEDMCRDYLREQEKARTVASMEEVNILTHQKDDFLSSPVPDAWVSKLDEKRKSRTTPKILVVDDDDFSGLLVKKNLSTDHDVIVASEGSGALNLYFKEAPDVVFLDIDMPFITGMDLLKKVRMHDSNAYIVMLSGKSDKEHVIEAVQKGAKGFISKPFTRHKLLQYIDEHKKDA